MKVLVTGAAGFIGSHTTEALLARGDAVVGLDNFDDYYSPEHKRENLRQVADAYPGLRFVEGDVRDRQLIEQLCKDESFEAIVHLAALAGVRASVDEPHRYYDVNVNGTLTLLEAARRRRPAVFVLASTSSVYGDSERIPFTEGDLCDHPLAPYPASKRAAELLGYTYHHLHGLNVTALRFFTVYGPRNRPDMMAHKILDNIFRGHRVGLYRQGQLERDWTYVDDITAGVAAATRVPLGFEAINIGRGEPVLLADFIRHIERLAGKKTNLEPAEQPAADMQSTWADTTKAKVLLGYTPSISVERGVERLWHWYRTSVLG